jgi:hypothetical protein
VVYILENASYRRGISVDVPWGKKEKRKRDKCKRKRQKDKRKRENGKYEGKINAEKRQKGCIRSKKYHFQKGGEINVILRPKFRPMPVQEPVFGWLGRVILLEVKASPEVAVEVLIKTELVTALESFRAALRPC